MENLWKVLRSALFTLPLLAALGSAPRAAADYSQRFSLGIGLEHLHGPNETELLLGGEYEYRSDLFLGWGGSADYIFSSPGITQVAVPELFVHPLGTDFLVSVAPLLEFGSQTGTHLGARFGTRVPIPLGVVTLVPIAGYDFIAGGPNFTIGLGIEF